MILSEKLQSSLHIKGKYSYFFSKNPDILIELIAQTSFLPEDAPIAQRIWHLRHNNFNIKCCKICNNALKWKKRDDYERKQFCSLQCMGKDDVVKINRKKSIRASHGVENVFQHSSVKDKIKITNLEKYGVENVMQNTIVKQLQHDALFKKYGVVNPLHHSTIKERVKTTNLEKYGVECVFQNDVIKEKIKNSNLKKYGVEYRNQRHLAADTLNKLNDCNFLIEQHINLKKTLTQIASELKCDYTTVSRYARDHGIQIIYAYTESTAERELKDFLRMRGIAFTSSDRSIISPYELDIFIESYNIGIEYCGVYWHSEASKENNYHKLKYDLCKQQGIRLITIFEDEWIYRHVIVENKLKHILGISLNERIFARKCEIGTVTIDSKAVFFDINHIQGNGASSINIGLYVGDELVACMGFIKERFGSYNLSRFATSKIVVGGFTKLLSHFERQYNPNRIYTFADLRWSEGDLYYKSGFQLDKELLPDYSYTIADKRSHKFNFRHRRLAKILEEYDPTLSEHENCLNHGIYRIYDCGKLRFVKKYNNL